MDCHYRFSNSYDGLLTLVNVAQSHTDFHVCERYGGGGETIFDKVHVIFNIVLLHPGSYSNYIKCHNCNKKQTYVSIKTVNDSPLKRVAHMVDVIQHLCSIVGHKFDVKEERLLGLVSDCRR